MRHFQLNDSHMGPLKITRILCHKNLCHKDSFCSLAILFTTKITYREADAMFSREALCKYRGS